MNFGSISASSLALARPVVVCELSRSPWKSVDDILLLPAFEGLKKEQYTENAITLKGNKINAFDMFVFL